MKALQEFSSKGSLAGDERWELVLRIAETDPFRRSLRLRSFLLYVCERTLQGRTEDVHEAQIGCDVFGKAAGYNQGDDNIVRVSARQLRRKLNEYFEGQGKDEKLRLVIPTGGYVPVFEPRPEEPEPAPFAIEPEPGEDASAPPSRDRRLWFLGSLAAALAVACAVLAFQNAGLRKAAVPFNSTLNPVLAALFEHDRPTKIVVSDSSYSFAQDLGRTHNTLYQYIDAFPRSFFEAPRSKEMNEVVRQTLRRQYTALADLNATVRLIQMSAPYWRNTGVFFARNVVARDLKGANLILIGSKRSNPWAEMFEEPLNFRYRRNDDTGQPYFVNRSPRPGELPVYDNASGLYADIALLPNIDHSGRVLILAGANNTGTEAAGEFVANNRQMEAMVKNLKLAGPNGKLASFEVLIRLSSIAGVPRESAVVAWRVGISP